MLNVVESLCAVGWAKQVERWNIFTQCNCCWKGWLWSSWE